MTNVSSLRSRSTDVSNHRETTTVEAGSSILGIWRIGQTLHRSPLADLSLAQPADAFGSPRFDYVLKRAIADEIESRRQITQFVAAASAVSHPNLIAVLDASGSTSSPYLVMPRLQGETMQAHLNAPQRKPLPVALWLVRQVAQALDAMHTGGWVHGDVKPENVMVGIRGHVTLVDLGFATRTHTVSGHHYRGTPAYSAPEMAAGNYAAMPAADVFSLGRILWQSLAHTHETSRLALEPIAEIVEAMVSEDPASRPTASVVAKQLLKWEIETLGRHIGPVESVRRAA